MGLNILFNPSTLDIIYQKVHWTSLKIYGHVYIKTNVHTHLAYVINYVPGLIMWSARASRFTKDRERGGGKNVRRPTNSSSTSGGRRMIIIFLRSYGGPGGANGIVLVLLAEKESWIILITAGIMAAR